MQIWERLYHYQIVVHRVIDGDTVEATIDVGAGLYVRDYLRLAEVDTPETNRADQRQAGLLAKQFTSDWLAHQDALYFQSLRFNPREKYGRLLGKIYRGDDEVDLSSALRAAGHVKGGTVVGSAEPHAQAAEPPADEP